ncbi:hypothetical protein ALP82_103095 [Pseudomonas savastanoi pv. fraxini]|nr:hypothetical protein ALO49_102865 [Pseudomonas savastanoi pv. retacarpa]KUG40978.1 hypothetical protein ALP79_102868 [Pseudomonas savastanoi pv. fraxini]RMP45714.1 hypothetical protein ALQ22_102881 [Pseudomonas savastanoi pv. retacarpa]RMR70813.1 hypothetical protein ALP81_103129 [Pseudomonas savastanoi pv. fraxini]RMR72173.1 hypothetical protein ALP82_103095 [Pseudomonas savastanoi pv. fraxini]
MTSSFSVIEKFSGVLIQFSSEKLSFFILFFCKPLLDVIMIIDDQISSAQILLQ